ncbi:MAG: hypothetical protein ACUVQX_00920 [Candidatus Bathycorpusculaceae bacterium]
MPWEITDQYIHSGHRSPEEFEPNSLRTIVLSESEGIKAVVGKPKGKDAMEVQSYLFEISKGWTLKRAKEWFKRHYENFRASLSFRVLEKIVDKPLRIRGVALRTGMSRNFNIYTPEELQAFADKLVSAPVYVEHVAVPNAVGKIVKAEWDGANLLYEAEIYDEEVAEKIRKGLIQHVSVGADYETIEVIDGKIPHGLHNAELSLVAVPGIPETNIQIMERLKLKEQEFEPIISGEYILGFCQDLSAFLPEHFSTVWLDKENGVLAIIGKLRAEPQTQRVQSIFFAKEKMWDEGKIRDWLLLHPQYMAPAGSSTPSPLPLQKPLFERVWTRKYIDALPDSAFAVVYRDNGETIRKFPHHNSDGAIDPPHLRNANTRLPQSQIPQEYKHQAMKHLATHKKKLGIGASAEEEKLLEQEGEDKAAHADSLVSQEPTMDELIASLENIIEEIDNAINALKSRVERLEKDFAEKPQSEDGVKVAESFLKNSKNTIPVEEAIKMIQNVLPSSMVERSWGLGPQRLCQELRGVILNLRKRRS